MSSIENIKLAAKTYLERKNTQYAIMIDGDWGVGKTHLFNTELIPIIGKKEAIYISLFGLSTIADIDNEIFKVVSIVGGDDDGILKGLLNANPGVAEDIKVGGLGYAVQFGLKMWKSRKLEKSKALTLCFDDIERWEGDIGICLSYINKLVEHQESKCIIIGCLSRFSKENKKKFSSIREKTIRHIYKLENKPDVIFTAAFKLVSFLDKSSSKYIRSLIDNNFPRISYLIEASNCRSIRTVSDSIQILDYIYSRNKDQFKVSQKLAISYYCALLSTLILIRKYIVDPEIQSKVLGSDNNSSYEVLEGLGYFEKEDTANVMTKEVKDLLETIFGVPDEITLSGIFSIVTNSFYIEEDFENHFDAWKESQPYEYYIDTFSYWYMEDEKALNVFNATIKQLFDKKSIRNPVTLLLITDRVTSDIKRGVINLDFEETKARILSLFEELYETKAMERKEVLDLSLGIRKFEYCSDVVKKVTKLNTDYVRTIANKLISEFWCKLENRPEDLEELFLSHQHEPLFAIYDSPKDIVDALSGLNNGQLFVLTRLMGSRLTNSSCYSAVNEEREKAKAVAELILSTYSKIYSVRAGHFMQVARILLNLKTDYDLNYLEGDSEDK